jgi:hypothetical protein
MAEQLQEAIPSSVQLRAMLEEMVVKDLRGPSLPDEEIDEPSVRDRYLVGMLAPRRQHQDDHTVPERLLEFNSVSIPEPRTRDQKHSTKYEPASAERVPSPHGLN